MIRFLRQGGAACGAALLAVLLTAAPAHADRTRDDQWYLSSMKLDQAQKLGKGGEGVIVAVVDTGVDTKHQDLRGATVPGRNEATDSRDDGIDDLEHGTGIAAMIAGRGHGSGDGILGVAPKSRVMPIRPVGDAYFVATGIRYAVAHGAKVINMSFELKDLADEMQKAIDEAYAADVVVVAGVGNEEGAPVAEPASLNNVIAVGAVDEKNKVASFSNHGKAVDLVAPGTNIPNALPDNAYDRVQGTSVSSALVSGVVALMRARFPDMTAPEIVDRLTKTAIDRGAKGRDDIYGFGQIDVTAALTAPRTPPAAATTAPTATTAPIGAQPQAAEPADPARPGIPPLLIVGLGCLLLVLVAAGAGVFFIVRAQRNR